MAWVAVTNKGVEVISNHYPVRLDGSITGWCLPSGFIQLPNGSIKALIGRDLTWQDEPVELVESDQNKANDQD